jgi:hypothetical protein
MHGEKQSFKNLGVQMHRVDTADHKHSIDSSLD